ncbi:MAG: hypothetical protein K1X79_11715 [Oligoflexia bacterium]|nr:hypothetical protein [Oligoflexia bacterium]
MQTLLKFSLLTTCAILTICRDGLAQSNPSLDDGGNFQVMNTRRLSGRIALTASDGISERIVALDLDGGKVRTLVDAPGNNSYATFSPDGKSIAFASDRDGNKEIYVAEWDGSNPRRLTQNTVADDNPTWNANGDKIVYYSDTGDASSNLMEVEVATGKITQLTHFKDRNTTPRVSPVDNTIAFSTSRFWPGWDVCFWHPTTKSESCPLQGKTSFCRPSWSPSGKMIAYSSGTLDFVDIAYLDLESGSKVTLTDMAGKEYDPAFSPSGGLIAFVSEAEKRGQFSLYMVDLQKKITPLLKSAYSLRYPSWSAAKTIELEAARIRENELKESLASATPASTTAPAVSNALGELTAPTAVSTP